MNILNATQKAESVIQKEANVAGSVLNFAMASMLSSLMLMTGTAVAKAIFTNFLPFDHSIMSKEGYEIRRAATLVLFSTFIVSILRIVYPAGLPISLGGSFGSASTNGNGGGQNQSQSSGQQFMGGGPAPMPHMSAAGCSTGKIRDDLMNPMFS